ncbi:acyltransferase [[Actinomadura] parvosata subsp. kistnae]|uniref:acyltransferase family protein n=1 Tax=[Actinomadura] parvosata TaxID=1955412 RepID=UPI0009AC948A|nr:acyltransferase [Nonomuraea sp. ATCC 55076]SPL93372.1 acyltransferase [Actinomadura parvosata subsp. kistnae]
MSINLADLRGDGGPRAGVLTQPPPPAGRQTWLDALRGAAVLAVLFEHLLDPLFPEVRAAVSPRFDFGQYGVMLFFLVSGYVVPASLERRGSVTGFWIGRAFRLYPLWAVVAVAGTVFGLAQVYAGLPDALAEHPVTAGLAHLTMLQDFLQVVSVVNVFWTLSYEMVFYLLVTALFVVAPHRPRTTGVLVVAMAGVLAGGLLPAGALSRALGGDAAVLLATAVLVAGMAAILGGAHRGRVCGAIAVAVLAVVLLGWNSRVGAWQSLAIVATMFAGTALNRLDHGRLHRGARWVVAMVPVVCVVAALRFGPGWGMSEEEAVAFRWSWSAAVVAAWLTFMGFRTLRPGSFRVPRAVRLSLPRPAGFRVPRPAALLVRLGVLSYSVYLLHPLVVQVLRRLVPYPAQVPLTGRIGLSLVVASAVVGAATLTHRFVELPAQALGRRVVRAHARRG